MGIGHLGRSIGSWLKRYGLTTLLLLAVAALAVGGITGAAEASYDEQLRQAELAVRRAAVTCYAVEGAYPDSYDYLQAHYNVQVDEEKFFVAYTPIGSNIMPEILVVEVGR